MSFVVKKSSPPMLVAPSKPTPSGDLPLTSTDKSCLFIPFTSFHVFEHRIHEPAETIRRSLSEALVHYYPVAGRFAIGGANGEGDVYISCTGEGVPFVSATASCTLKDVRLLHTPLVIPLAELAVRYAGGRCRVSDPLMTVQVTEFTCGGYVVAVTWNHGITDASGLAQLLEAVGEIASGRPSPSIVPVRYDASFPDIPQLLSAIRKRLQAGLAATKQVDFDPCDFTIPRSFVNRIKQEFRKQHTGGRPCTTFEAVTAAIWQCRTRAINTEPGPGVLTPLLFSANVRRFIGAKDGYYGNCLTMQLVTATSGNVANCAVVDLVRLIQDAKEWIPDCLAGVRKPEVDDDLIAALSGYNMLGVSSWGGTGLDAVDFGGGRPARVVPDVQQRAPACFPCLPCSRADDFGVNVVAFCVTEEHVEHFQAELARLR